MKKILFITVIAIIGLSLSAPDNSSKIGFVDLDDILATMPEMMEIEQRVNNYARIKNSELAKMSVHYGEKYQEFESKKEEYSDEITFKKQAELDELSVEIQQFSGENKKQITLKRKLLCKPITLRIKKAIKILGEEKGFVAVFNSKNESLLFSSKSNDITEMVRDAVIK